MKLTINHHQKYEHLKNNFSKKSKKETEIKMTKT